MSVIFFLMSIKSISHEDLCHSVDFKGQGPQRCNSTITISL